MMRFFNQIIAGITAFLMSIAAFFGINTGQKNIRNVILLIGDGTGFNHLEKTKQERGISLAMDSLPQSGFSMTHSATDAVTDSAAGGTALACGIKTYNGAIGYYWFGEPGSDRTPGSQPLNITELCRDNGMKTGIVTTDYITGATPAAFSAHTAHRENTAEIAQAQLASGFDLIWGLDDGTITREQAADAGYTYIDTTAQMNRIEGGTKTIGLFTSSLHHLYNVNEYTPNLEQMTTRAIDILDDTDEGFFLMVEGAHIDKKSHDNNGPGMTEALEEFDKTVAAAVDYAKKDRHTLVVVTADHETGGIAPGEDGTYTFTQTYHSAANVPVRAYGHYDFIKKDETVENVEIPKRIAAALEFPENSFPREVIPTN